MTDRDSLLSSAAVLAVTAASVSQLAKSQRLAIVLLTHEIPTFSATRQTHVAGDVAGARNAAISVRRSLVKRGMTPVL